MKTSTGVGAETTPVGMLNVAVETLGGMCGMLQSKRAASRSDLRVRTLTIASLVCAAARFTVAVTSLPPRIVAVGMTKDGLPLKQASPTVSLAVQPFAQAVMRRQLPLVVLSLQLYIAPGVQSEACVEPPHMLPFTGCPRMFSEVQLCATVLSAERSSFGVSVGDWSGATHAARTEARHTVMKRIGWCNGFSVSDGLS